MYEGEQKLKPKSFFVWEKKNTPNGIERETG